MRDFEIEYSDSESDDDENDEHVTSSDLEKANDFIDNCNLDEEESVAIKNPYPVKKIFFQN